MNYQKNAKFYFLNIDLGEKRTGIENASLLRARIFKHHLNISPIIITAKYNPRLNLQRKALTDNRLISDDIQIINLYEYFQETVISFQEHSYDQDQWNHNDNWVYKPVEKKKDWRVYDHNNNQIMYQHHDKNGILMYNNIIVNKKKVRRDTYDSNGYLSRVQQLDSETGEVCFETYYRSDGTPCIYKHFDIINKKSNLSCIHLLNKRGEIIETFSTEQEFISYWLLEILDDSQYHYLIIDKERTFYPALKNINKRNVFKICVIHSSHLQENQPILEGKLNRNYIEIFEDLTKPDAVVVSTLRQKEHIEERFGSHDHLVVIPHAFENKVECVNFEDRVPLTVIYLARYSPEKQHESLVRIFHKVLQHHPHAKLNLYGFGNHQLKILDLVKSLGLENSINVNDFVEDPKEIEKIYNTASLAVLTSQCEGFSLFVLESIAHGCPVISYDVDYGPRDMIEHDVNGYLVKLNDEETMTQYIIDVFNNREKLRSMSRASYQKAEQFSAESVAEKWASLFQYLNSLMLMR